MEIIIILILICTFLIGMLVGWGGCAMFSAGVREDLEREILELRKKI
jgi:hypothetical protein